MEEYIAVDLDGCLAHYDEWKGPYAIGKPVAKMVAKVKAGLKRGKKFKIFTARVASDRSGKVKQAIEKWSLKNLGVKLEVTNVKDKTMVEFWDDRARRIRKNTGTFESILKLLRDGRQSP